MILLSNFVPDLYEFFDPSHFASFLSQKSAKIKNDLAAQGVTIPTYSHFLYKLTPGLTPPSVNCYERFWIFR